MDDEVYGEPPSSAEVAAMAALLALAVDKWLRDRARRTTIESAMEDPAKPMVKWEVNGDACEFCKKRGSFLAKPGDTVAESHRGCKCHPEQVFDSSSMAKAKRNIFDRNDSGRIDIGRKAGEGCGYLGTNAEIEACEDFSQLHEVLKQYGDNVIIAKSARGMDFVSVRQFFSSFVGTCIDTYGVRPSIGTITAVDGGGFFVYLNPTKKKCVDVVLNGDAFRFASRGRELYAIEVSAGRSPAGTSFASLGAHEATHMAESFIAFVECPTAHEACARLGTEWIENRVARRAIANYNNIVEEDVTDAMIASVHGTLAQELSFTIIGSPRETMCEAAHDLDSNGIAANKWSSYFVQAVKELCNEAKVTQR